MEKEYSVPKKAHMMAIGLMTRGMEQELSFTKIRTSIQGNGLKIESKEKESCFIIIETDMKANFIRIKNMAMVCKLMQIINHMKGNGSMEFGMEKAF